MRYILISRKEKARIVYLWIKFYSLITCFHYWCVSLISSIREWKKGLNHYLSGHVTCWMWNYFSLPLFEQRASRLLTVITDDSNRTRQHLCSASIFIPISSSCLVGLSMRENNTTVSKRDIIRIEFDLICVTQKATSFDYFFQIIHATEKEKKTINLMKGTYTKKKTSNSILLS